MVFNPQQPNVEPKEYQGYSKGISQPEARKPVVDNTAAATIGAVNTILGAGITAADTVIKEKIKSDIYGAVDKERDLFTRTLEETRNAMPNAPGMDSDPTMPYVDQEGNVSYSGANTQTDLNRIYAQANNQDLTTATNPNRPRDIEELPNRLEVLQGAYEKGLPYTVYYSRMAQIAKEMREQHPGYREYIDRQINGILGTNPANAYIRALSQNIAAAASTKGALDPIKLTLNKLYAHPELEGQPEAINELLSTGDFAKANKFLNKALVYKSQKDTLESDLAVNRLNNQQWQDENRPRLQQDVYRTAQKYFTTVFDSLGADTPEKLAKLTDSLIQNDKAISKEQADTWLRNVQMREDNARRELTYEWNRIRGKDDKGNDWSYASKLGGAEEAKKMIDAGLASIFDPIKQRLGEGQAGFALQHARSVKSRLDAAQYDLLNSKVGRIAAADNAIRAIGGDGPAANFFKALNQKEVAEAYKELFNTWAKGITIQTRDKDLDAPQVPGSGAQAPSNPNAIPVPVQAIRRPLTLNEALQDARDKGVPDSSRYYEQFVKLTSDMLSKKPVDKGEIDLYKNWFTATFTPGNRNFLANFNKEYTDRSGRVVPGKYSVYSRLTNQATAENVYYIAQMTGDPGLGRMYSEWVKTEFRNQLFAAELGELNKMATDGRFIMSWNDTTNSLQVIPNPAAMKPNTTGPMRSVNSAQVELAEMRRWANYYQGVVDNLNTGFRGLVNIANATGVDPNQYVYRFLVENGFNPSKQDPGSALDQIGTAILSSQTPPEKPAGGSGSRKTQGGTSSTPNSHIPHFAAPEVPLGGSIEEQFNRITSGASRRKKPVITPPPAAETEIPGSFRVDDNPRGLSPRQFDQQK